MGVGVDQNIKRAVARIIYELNTILEECQDPRSHWYALDRFATIEEVARQAHNGDAKACVYGLDAPPDYFDREYTVTVE